MKENGISTTGLIEIAGNGASLPQSSWPKKVKWTTRQSWVKFCGHITFVAPYIWEISHMMSPRWKQNSPSQLVGKFGCRYVTWTPPTRYTCTRLGFRTKQSEGSDARQIPFSSEAGGAFQIDNAVFWNSWVVTSRALHPRYRWQWPRVSTGAIWWYNLGIVPGYIVFKPDFPALLGILWAPCVLKETPF